MSIPGVLRARYLFLLAGDQLTSTHPLAPGIASALLQDAVEALAHEAAASVGADTPPTIRFHEYWDRIAATSSRHRLPYKQQMQDLNQARIGFKHHGVVPAGAEAEKFARLVHRFLVETSQLFFEVDFDSVSESDMIAGLALRQAIQAAERRLMDGDLKESLHRCADALAVIDAGLVGWFPVLTKGPAPRPARESNAISEVVNWAHQRFATLEKAVALGAIGASPTEYWLVQSLIPHRSQAGGYHFVQKAGGQQSPPKTCERRSV